MVYAAGSGTLLMMVGCLSMFQNGEEYEDASERHLCRKLVTDVPANTSCVRSHLTWDLVWLCFSRHVILIRNYCDF
jgi:hypothetical protein